MHSSKNLLFALAVVGLFTAACGPMEPDENDAAPADTATAAEALSGRVTMSVNGCSAVATLSGATAWTTASAGRCDKYEVYEYFCEGGALKGTGWRISTGSVSISPASVGHSSKDVVKSIHSITKSGAARTVSLGILHPQC